MVPIRYIVPIPRQPAASRRFPMAFAAAMVSAQPHERLHDDEEEEDKQRFVGHGAAPPPQLKNWP